MSRILQALKQLEARPAGDAEAAVSPTPTVPITPAEVQPPVEANDAPAQPAASAPPAAPSRMPTTPLRRALEKQLSAEPPAMTPPLVTEPLPPEPAPPRARTTPRRKRRQARRVAQDAAPLERLDEIQAMLGKLGPGVIECWNPEGASSSAIVTDAPADEGATMPTVLVHEQLPQVVRVVEPVPTPPPPPEVREPEQAARPQLKAEESAATAEQEEALTALLASLVPSVVQCWSPEMAAGDAVVIETPAPEGDAGATVVVQEQLPEVVHVEVEVATPPVEADAHGNRTVPIVHDVEPPVSEVELRFQSPPRRTERRPKVAPVKRRERKRQAATAREQEMRTLVRGPKSPATVPSTPWETTIQADLEDPRVAGGLRRLVDSWQQEHAQHDTTTLLVASLGASLLAAEVVMRAGALLAEATESAVLVVDADEEGALSRRLALTSKPGLAELLAPDDAHGETIFPTATPRVHVLPRGRIALPAQTNAGDVRRLLRELSTEYAYVLVAGGALDGPVMSAVARGARGTYVVVPAGQINVETARQGLGLLQAAGARVLGSVLVGG